ncbi:MAG: aconitate hydratase [Syntrophobacterales bacterium]|nr:aconitate hydratase [Syntrophobacterales bacterium]
MGKSITRKIIEAHLISGSYNPGSEAGIKIDQTLTQDATGTMAYLQFESMNIPEVKTDLSVSYIDHNTVQIGFENADDHQYLRDIAGKYGIHLSRAGNGICHQVHLERFGMPGKTLLGSDSHTPTAGGIGMLAIGAGGLDVAIAMGGGAFYLTCPQVIKINLIGKLSPWVSAKDIILKVLEMFTTKGNVGCVFEYGGNGLSSLTVPERATIANMGAECGVTTSIFPSDEMTLSFLESQQRKNDWTELKADADAEYDRIIDIDLSKIVPLAATPHSPENIRTVKDINGIKVDQVCVGSCTNSSYKDLSTVAEILRGEIAHPDVSFVIAPGSKQVLENLSRDGYLGKLLSSGARIAESACGFCIGNSQSPPSGAVSLRTSNRNFSGRSGTADAGVYLVSPETAAAAVITGVITDPRDLGIEYPLIRVPERFIIDDRMIIFPEDIPDPSSITVRRGPNIGTPPSHVPMPDTISGEVTIKVEDRITTDHIMPAGFRMKYRSNIPKYAEFVFEGVDSTFHERALRIKSGGKHNIIVAGVSYGQGSSREHAAICPQYLGVKAVIARSFERIHAANLINFGIMPLTFKNDAAYAAIDQGDEIEIPDIRNTIESDKAIIVKNKTKGTEFEVLCDLSDRQRKILLAGGALAAEK